MTKRKAALKVGDEVALHWWDIYSQERVTGGEDKDAEMPEFVSYGKVSYIGHDKIVLWHEFEIVAPGKPLHREPTIYPIGCVKAIRCFTRDEEVTFKKRTPTRR